MKRKRKKHQPNDSFKDAICATPEVKEGFQLGLKALGSNSTKIELEDSRECNGSVDIDACVCANYPNANRCDYVLSYKQSAYFVEVHSAESNEVKVVVAKLQWLKDWLNTKAPEIAKLKAPKTPYYWIQSGRFNIPKNTPQYRRAAQNGILPIAKLSLS